MGGLGFHPTLVERPRNKLEAIAAARAAFAHCQFDEQACGLGLRRLRACRKEWDESRGLGLAVGDAWHGPYAGWAGRTRPTNPRETRLCRKCLPPKLTVCSNPARSSS
jgi:hypothetical protein